MFWDWRNVTLAVWRESYFSSTRHECKCRVLSQISTYLARSCTGLQAVQHCAHSLDRRLYSPARMCKWRLDNIACIRFGITSEALEILFKQAITLSSILSQLARGINLYCEQSVEVVHEILRRAFLDELADLLSEIDGLQLRKRPWP